MNVSTAATSRPNGLVIALWSLKRRRTSCARPTAWASEAMVSMADASCGRTCSREPSSTNSWASWPCLLARQQIDPGHGAWMSEQARRQRRGIVPIVGFRQERAKDPFVQLLDEARAPRNAGVGGELFEIDVTQQPGQQLPDRLPGGGAARRELKQESHARVRARDSGFVAGVADVLPDPEQRFAHPFHALGVAGCARRPGQQGVEHRCFLFHGTAPSPPQP